MNKKIESITSSPIIQVLDHQRTPLCCEMCWNVLSSLHKIIFNVDLEDSSGLFMLNDIILYLRYFNFNLEKIDQSKMPTLNMSNPNYKTNYFLHFAFDNKPICAYSYQELYSKLIEKLQLNNEIQVQKKPESNTNNTPII